MLKILLEVNKHQDEGALVFAVIRGDENCILLTTGVDANSYYEKCTSLIMSAYLGFFA